MGRYGSPPSTTRIPSCCTYSRTFKCGCICFWSKSIFNNLDAQESPGPDGITAMLLKEVAPEISDSVTSIFNKSLTSGVFPEKWKDSNQIKCILCTPRPIHWSTYQPMYRPIYRPRYVGRHIGRYIGRLSPGTRPICRSICRPRCGCLAVDMSIERLPTIRRYFTYYLATGDCTLRRRCNVT